MQTSLAIRFISPATSSGRNNFLKWVIAEEDNILPVEQWREDYYNENGEYPTTVSKEDVEVYSQKLDESLVASFTTKVRLYGYSKVSAYDVFSVRANSVIAGSERTGNTSETVSVNGSSTLSLTYPIDKTTSLSFELVTEDGQSYQADPVVTATGVLDFGVEVYGFLSVSYDHSWREYLVKTRDEIAKDKRPSYLLVRSSEGVDSIEVNYQDVEDPDSGIVPSDETYIKIWAHRNKSNVASRDPLEVEELFEVSRTISPIDVDGVQIERARTVTFRKGEGTQQLRMNFDLPLIGSGGGSTNE
ncbi:hypothetical protein [Vibrio phage vB_VpaS_VP-RY-9]|nr:hypothetical protein [Vibrio phage vB_VpaS_VP-RY-9]